MHDSDSPKFKTNHNQTSICPAKTSFVASRTDPGEPTALSASLAKSNAAVAVLAGQAGAVSCGWVGGCAFIKSGTVRGERDGDFGACTTALVVTGPGLRGTPTFSTVARPSVQTSICLSRQLH